MQDMNNPTPEFQVDNDPKELSDKDKKKEVKKMIQLQNIKNNVAREDLLMKKFNKVYALICGKCTQRLQGVVKNIDKYKHDANDLFGLSSSTLQT